MNIITAASKTAFIKHTKLYSLLALSSLAFAFFWLPSKSLFDDACNLLIILFVTATVLPENTDLRKNPMVRLCLLFAAYLLFTVVWHRFTLPENFPRTSSARRFLRVFYFLPIAYSISRSNLLSPWRFLVVAFIGLLVYLTLNFNKTEWLHAWQGQRVDFGIHNAQHTGIVFATSALAFSAFSIRAYQKIKQLSLPAAITCTVAWLAGLIFSFWGVFVSQTRAAWLGLLATLLVLPLIFFLARNLQKQATFSLRKPLLVFFAGATILCVTAYSLDIPDTIHKRLSSENVSWTSLRQAASHDKTDLTSFEIRVASWSAATEWIMEKPFLGWGGRGSNPLIKQSSHFSESFKAEFGHLHNSYLEVLVEIGLLGAGFIFSLILFLGRSSINSYKKGNIPTDAFIFSWLFFVFWLVVNCFESYIVYRSGTYLVALVAAFFYAFNLNRASGTITQRGDMQDITS